MPHPVRTPARFRLTIPEAQPVQVEDYDLLVGRVTTVFDGTTTAGRRRDLPLRTDRLAGGVHFLRITGEDFTATERVTVVR